MPIIPPQKLVSLQSRVQNIRNFCLLAHVDHGKTTLADSLLASNGIISNKMAGTIRYLDSREDEMVRGITMMGGAPGTKQVGTSESEEYLLNLIDSPGHVDFSSEVSSASRLCDGALILVDVVEGVCSQTVSVMRQAWVENLRPILVLNKMDRLIVELKLSSIEAFLHLTRLVEQVNAIMGSFYTGELMELPDEEEPGKSAPNNPEDEHIYFVPERGNVVFASAYDGWAFTLSDFADLYAAKLGFKRETLLKVLWGDYYLDLKSKKVVDSKHIGKKGAKPMFVQFVLDNIWSVYESVVMARNFEKVEKIVKSLSLKVHLRDMKSKDSRNLLLSIFGQWLPLARAVLLSVANIVSSPIEAQKVKAHEMLKFSPGGDAISSEFADDISTCNPDSPFSLTYISKMVAVPVSELPQNQRKQLTADEMRQMARDRQARAQETNVEDTTEAQEPAKIDDLGQKEGEELIAFARIYCGQLRREQTIYAYGPKYSPSTPNEHVTEVKIDELYMLMGRELVPLDIAHAGNTVGIAGLEGKVLRSATLSTEKPGINLSRITGGQAPIVRVALEPTRPSEMKQLEDGLKLLSMSDSCVEVFIQDSGEHVIMTAGELHLERCLKDLRERFAKVDIQSSQPIVPYRETIVSPIDPKPLRNPDLPRGTFDCSILNDTVKFRTRVLPLEEELTQFIKSQRSAIQALLNQNRKQWHQPDQAQEVDQQEEITGAEAVDFTDEALQASTVLSSDQFRGEFQKLVTQHISEKLGKNGHVAALGPKRVGPNVLYDLSGKLRRFLESPHVNGSIEGQSGHSIRDLLDYIITGFQIATQQGPLCAEPAQGTLCVVESVEVQESESQIGQIAGNIISNMRDGFRQGFLDWSPRLMLAMYSCDIQATTEVLGKVYGVVTKRKGRITAEEMKEGTPFFIIKALLPVAESFGFADDIRKRTSGAASPQLLFSGFEMLEQDPFWVPSTEEELEDLGELADRENVARNYMDAVRKRKGLFVDKKIIKNAEKQRNLKR